MKQYVIGLDLGTGGVRAVLVDETGYIAKEATSAYPMYQPHNGWAEQEGEDWLRASCEVLRSVTQGVPAECIKALGLTGQMSTIIPLDKHMKPLRRAILWCDQRAEAQIPSMQRLIGDENIKKITCSKPIVGLGAAKWLWIVENEPEIAAQTRALLPPKDFMRLMLTGDIATDVEDASALQLLDVPNRRWSEEMLSPLSLRSEWVGKAYESHCVTGTVTRAAAEMTGLPEGLPVVAGTGDNGASAVGMGVLDEGEGFVTIGTSGVVYAPFTKPRTDAKYCMNTMCAPTPDTWHALSSVQTAGLCMRWFRDNVFPGDEEYAAINKAVEKTPVGANGLIYLPYMMGERTPHQDPQCRSAFFGLSASHTRDDMARAVMEGVSLGLRDCLDVIRSTGVTLRELRFCGGGSKSPVWRQMLADIFNLPVVKGNGSAAVGAAILAAVGGGLYPDTHTACAHMVHCTEQSDPDAQRAARYEELLSVYRLGYQAQKEISQKLASFR